MPVNVENLSKSFGETRALDGLTFRADEGQAFGLLGRNGAGKTTCIRIIMNIFRGDGGQVQIDGIPAEKNKKRIGYLPEERGLYPKVKILDQMIYIGQLRGLTASEAKKSGEKMLEELEATEYINKKVQTLSKGNQQKIQLAISLLSDPDILILDEPFSGLDPVNAQLLKRMVRRQVDRGKTVLFSSHQMAQVEEFCDEICIIDKGKDVLKGNLSSIKRSYPRNRIFLDPGEDAPPDFENRLREQSFVQALERSGTGCIITLTDPSQRGALYNALGGMAVAPEKFSVLEPSLEEIFVECAGRSA